MLLPAEVASVRQVSDDARARCAAVSVSSRSVASCGETFAREAQRPSFNPAIISSLASRLR